MLDKGLEYDLEFAGLSSQVRSPATAARETFIHSSSQRTNQLS